MIRRYVVATAVIMAVSIGSAGAVHLATNDPEFRASCVFRALVRVSHQQPPGEEFLKFTNSLAAAEVAVANGPAIYAATARKHRIDPGAFVSRVFTTPGPGLATYGVVVTDPDPRRAVTVANEICDEYVRRIAKHRDDVSKADIDSIRRRIKPLEDDVRRLEAIPPKRRTIADQTALAANRQALAANASAIAALLSLPPGDVSVQTRAVATQRLDKSPTRNLLIALVGGLLASFLVVLVGEVMSERRRRPIAASTSPDETLEASSTAPR